MLSVEDARRKVIKVVAGLRRAPCAEEVRLEAAAGRILAEEIFADRDYPPFDRAARDGFAVRSADCQAAGASLRVVGEVRAGAAFEETIGAGECVEIMTGAPVPAGADAVVMVEHTRKGARADEVVIQPAVEPGWDISPRGSEARSGESLLPAGMRLGFAELGIAAQCGSAKVRVFRRPRVAILSTGDEVIPVDATPRFFEIRNSNSISLASQIQLAGGEAVVLGNSADRADELRDKIERGLQDDALVLSGGVSMGKYDLVENVLRELGAEFYFDAVAIRPGRPTVFGVCKGKPVFGLPGNPVSTMVTCEVFATPAIDILGGGAARDLPLVKAKLAKAVAQKAELAYFLPARLDWPGGVATVTPLSWKGSGDAIGLAKGDCFLVVWPAKLQLDEGEWVDVLPRRGLF